MVAQPRLGLALPKTTKSQACADRRLPPPSPRHRAKEEKLRRERRPTSGARLSVGAERSNAWAGSISERKREGGEKEKEKKKMKTGRHIPPVQSRELTWAKPLSPEPARQSS